MKAPMNGKPRKAGSVEASLEWPQSRIDAVMGDVPCCDRCGTQMVRVGTCSKCLSCGHFLENS